MDRKQYKGKFYIYFTTIFIFCDNPDLPAPATGLSDIESNFIIDCSPSAES